MNFVKNNKLIGLVLAVTLVKGIIWAYVVPPFQAPDEQVHYASIQHYAEPKGYTPQTKNFPVYLSSPFDIKTQNLSPELRDFLEKSHFDKTRFKPQKKFDFKNFLPFRYQEDHSNLSRFVLAYPAWFTEYSPQYYYLGAFIENSFSGFNIAERSFFIRILSVLLGALFILFAYLMFRELALSKTTSALLAGAVSFQPMLTFITASINVDAFLFAAFGLFLWGAVRLIKRIDWLGISALLVGAILSALAKPSGYFAFAGLIFLLVLIIIENRERILNLSKRMKFLVFGSALTLVVAGSGAFVFTYQILKNKYFAGAQPLSILPAYIKHQLEYPILLAHSWFYWGNFGWLAIPIHRYYIHVLWAVMAIAFLGIIVYLIKYFIQKGESEENKKIFYQTIFLIFAVLGFFLMIHIVNFDKVNPNDVADESNSIAIQGRYFFPVMAAKFYFIFLGLTSLIPWISRRLAAWFLLTFMVILNLVGLIIYVVPRYYY